MVAGKMAVIKCLPLNADYCLIYSENKGYLIASHVGDAAGLTGQ